MQMALINCPECQKEVSDTVKTCPHCGGNVKKLLKQRKKAIAAERNKKTFIQLGIVFLVIVVIASFFESDPPKKSPKTASVTATKPKTTTTKTKPLAVDLAFVCKAVTASQFSKDIGIMSSTQQGGKYYVTYINPDDGKKWGIYCWEKGSRVVWQTDGRNNTSNDGKPGRVRDGKYDDYITYSKQGDNLVLRTKFVDGSSKTDKYLLPVGK